MSHTRNAVNVCAAEVRDKEAVDFAMHNLRLLEQLPLSIFSTIKQHDSFLGSNSYAVGTPARIERKSYSYANRGRTSLIAMQKAMQLGS